MDRNDSQHPLTNAGLGHGPYKVWTAIRLPLASLAATDPAVAGRRRDRIAREARFLHVPATDRCGICRQPQDDLYVIADGTERSVAALCADCIEATGDAGLTRKVRHLDHEHERKLGRLSPARRRVMRTRVMKGESR